LKLSISNIAWDAESDRAALDLLAGSGVAGIEVAPTRVWPEWQGITTQGIRDFRESVSSARLRISSLQSVLYSKPELKLFGGGEHRARLREHLVFCADLAAELGAESIVFGAPRNRSRGALSEIDAFTIASEFFSEIAEQYLRRSVCLVFEANPTEYGCDFMTDSATAACLVRAVGCPGFLLHIDTACLSLAKEDTGSAISAGMDILRHFHVAEPFLRNFADPMPSHAVAAQQLRDAQYSHWVVLEMRRTMPVLTEVQRAAVFLRATYSGDGNR
jgi:D-psicose/D-tagatose/L-ribulose 3-epimerase